MIISFANSYKTKFIWLGLFATSFIGLIVCIYLLVTKIAEKARDFGSSFANSVTYDNTSGVTYNLADSVNSKQIQYLKTIEPEEFKESVPDQFYNYLGFGHYYRLPLKFPFSLHCEDRLDKASLFNESKVTVFNQNDNGEEDCKVNGITDLVFDENILVAKVNKRDFETNEDSFIIYHFADGKTEKYNSLEEASVHARQLQFSRPLKLISCQDYYELLK
ncbi:MAG: hypothetical protein ACXVC7_10550 [Bacteroidia bacterium]